MSRIDPSLIDSQLTSRGLTPQPSILQRQQMDAARADQQAQIQERQAQADSLRLGNLKARAAYNASNAIRGVLANKPDASMQELLSVGGPEGIPIIKDLLDQRKSAIDQTKANVDNQKKMSDEMVEAFSLDPNEANHPEIERGLIQKWLQTGQINQDQANQMLQQPPDKVDQLKAHQAALVRTNAELDKAAERHLKEQQAFEATQKGMESFANAGEKNAEADRERQGLPGKVPTPTDRDKEVKSWLGSEKSKGYPQNEAGYNDYLEARNRKDQMDTALATERAKNGTDPRLTNVAPNLHKDVLDKVEKAEDAASQAQEAADNMNSFVEAARKGNKEAYAYSPVVGVLQINVAGQTKRINRNEIDAYGGAGSLFDRIQGAVGKQTSGASLSPSILNDMQEMSKIVASNAKSAHDRTLGNIDRTYRSKFSGSTGSDTAPNSFVKPGGALEKLLKQ